VTYLDWASTSPPDESFLVEAAKVAAENFGNPSSRHGLGSQAKARLEEARSILAQAIAGRGAEGGRRGGPGVSRLVFTSGGTESDGMVLLAVLRQALNARRDGSIKRLHIICTEIEHAAVYEEALLLKSLGLALSLVPAEADGRVDPAKIAAAVDKDSALVAVMAVNNETGAIQDIAGVATAVAEASKAFGREPPRLHVDAVQALGKTDFDPAAVGASSAAYSAHKIRGPRGAGALWLAAAPRSGSAFEALATGGGQEGGLRPGTESLQGAWAFAAAASAARCDLAQNAAHARALEERLLSGLALIPGALPLPLGRTAGDERYSPYILSAAFPGLSGEVLSRALADRGIAVSTGSACSSNSRRSGRRVLQAMGLQEGLSLSAIRISTGFLSSASDIDLFLEAADAEYRRLKT
jgi:cysteine desulfurase